jgi:hypothetical protein
MLAFGLVMWLAGGLAVAQSGESESPSGAGAETSASVRVELMNDRPVSEAWKRFAQLELWSDGLSEMSYYDATTEIYGKKRHYTRVHLMNRQFMDRVHYIKASEHTAEPVAVFKFVTAEEIPTENYNYRFLTTAFQEMDSLRPLKVSLSSQEWCGHTFKYLTWERRKEFAPESWSLDISCYSYLPAEGDRWFPHPGRAHINAFENVYLLARAVVASGGEAFPVRMLRSMRSNRLPDPDPLDAVLRVDGKPRRISVPLGSFEAQRVVLDWEGEETWFDVETAAPYRILAMKAGGTDARLRFVERRAYWDLTKKSGFYEQGKAP